MRRKREGGGERRVVRCAPHLEAREPAADDHGVLRSAGLDEAAHVVGVGNGAEAEHAGQVDAGQRGPDWGGAGGEEQLVVGLAALFAGPDIPHGEPLRVAVNVGGLCSVERCSEAAGRRRSCPARARPAAEVPRALCGRGC